MKISKARIGKTDVLMVDGVPQSTYPPTEGGYWQHMIPDDFSGHSVLMLGVGGGTIARQLLEKYPKVKIIGVDNNSLLIQVAERQFHISEIDMEIIIQDGFEFIKDTKIKFDLIIVDMWEGYKFPFKVLSNEFIKHCQAKLNEGGQVYINTPSLDYLAQESLKGLNALRDDIGRNIIYRFHN